MKSFLISLRHALDGLLTLIKSERNFQIHLFLFAIAIFLGFLFDLKNMEWIIILLTSALVLSVEALNTAIEKMADFVHPETHPSIKLIKDISAAAVLVVALLAIVIGLVIFLPHFLK